MSNFSFEEFPNLGYMMVKFTKEELLPIKKEVKKIRHNFSKSEKYNKYLAGEIKHEYKLSNSVEYLSNLVKPYAFEYKKKYGKTQNWIWESEKLELKQVWVNYQKKYEFNPWHKHSGVFAFVIWLKIPYLFEHENDDETTFPSKGSFSFLYTNTFGFQQSVQIKADKRFENKMILFPSNLMHQVYPFYTSNDYRISVSGNFWYVN